MLVVAGPLMQKFQPKLLSITVSSFIVDTLCGPAMSQQSRSNARSGGYSDPFGDAFGDPFFGGGGDPFASMIRQQEQMMANMSRMMGGVSGMFGGLGGMGIMRDMHHPAIAHDHMPRSRQQQPPRSSSGPIVEEPDSFEPTAVAPHYSNGYGAVAPSLSSFSSSSMSTSFSSGGGGGPVYFQSSTSTIKGPNGTKYLLLFLCCRAPPPPPLHHNRIHSTPGIIERTHSVRDSRTGIERTTMQVRIMQHPPPPPSPFPPLLFPLDTTACALAIFPASPVHFFHN
jgi:hypothetical protein